MNSFDILLNNIERVEHRNYDFLSKYMNFKLQIKVDGDNFEIDLWIYRDDDYDIYHLDEKENQQIIDKVKSIIADE